MNLSFTTDMRQLCCVLIVAFAVSTTCRHSAANKSTLRVLVTT